MGGYPSRSPQSPGGSEWRGELSVSSRPAIEGFRKFHAMSDTLTGSVAVVAGATRGAGRGIARALGAAGATVYCTGRSTRDARSPYNRPETIEETAEMIRAAGGTAIALRVDHTSEAEVAALFERVEREHGQLDI